MTVPNHSFGCGSQGCEFQEGPELCSHHDQVCRVFPRREDYLLGRVTVPDHFRNLATPPHFLRHPIANALAYFLLFNLFMVRCVDYP